jgi:hypothetical protein
MWVGDAQKPSAQLADLLSGKMDWDAAPDAIKSWAQLPIHQAAVQILSEPSKGTRRNMLGRIPATIRPHVEAEAKRLWGLRRT